MKEKIYTLKVECNLEKIFKHIHPKDQQKIKSYLDNLNGIADPFLHARKLQGSTNLYRYRVGNYRILAEINNNELVILIVDIGNRKDIYKKI